MIITVLLIQSDFTWFTHPPNLAHAAAVMSKSRSVTSISNQTQGPSSAEADQQQQSKGESDAVCGAVLGVAVYIL